MKRKSSIILTTLLTLALVISLVAIPTTAATTYTAIDGSTTFETNLIIDAGTSVPTVTFAYSIAAGTPAAATTTTIEILASDVAATVGTAAFSSSDTTTAGTPDDATDAAHEYATKDVTVTFPAGSFTKPGVYRYVITQTTTNSDGVVVDTDTTRYLDVFVVANANDELSIEKFICRNVDSEQAINLDDQNYADNPDWTGIDPKSDGYTNSLTQYDLVFSKAITGNQGDKNKRFTFTLNIADALPGTYVVETTDVTGNPTSITVGTGGTYEGTFDLTDGSSVTVKGLNAGATYTVSEAEQDYTPSYIYNGGASQDGDSYSDNTGIAADSSLAFTNERDGSIPTGIIMASAPYVIGLCLFGAVVIFMISRKKRQSVEEN